MIKPGDHVTVNGVVLAENGGYIQIRMKSGAECWIKVKDIEAYRPMVSQTTESFVDKVRAVYGKANDRI